QPGTTIGSSNPSVAFDSRGSAYVACLNNSAGILQEIAVSRIPHGAEMPDQRSSAAGGGAMLFTFLADPMICGDSSRGSPFRDKVYVSWVEGRGAPLPPGFSIKIARSTDGGATFSGPVTIAEAEDGFGRTSLAVGPDGMVYMSYLAVGDPGPNAVLRT